MELNKVGAVLIAATCVAVGAGGAYVATRVAAPAAADKDTPAATTSTTVAAGIDSAGSEPGVSSGTTSEKSDPEAPGFQTARPVRSSEPSPTRTVTARPVAPARTDPPAAAAPATPAAAPIVEESRPALAAEPARQTDTASTGSPANDAPQLIDLVVSANSVIGLQIETSLSSEQARVEDPVVAHVTRDVRVGDRVAIPVGAKAQGEVTLVERGGKVRERARLGVRFTSVTLPDGTRVPLDTDTIYREGESPTGGSAAKIGGGSIGGAILGGILGGAKGAALGGSIGGGAGTAAVMAGGRNPATLPAGTPVTVRLTRPSTVTVDQ